MVVSIFYRKKVANLAIKVKNMLIWNGLIRTFQISVMKLEVNGMMHILKGDNDIVASYCTIGLMFVISFVIFYYLSRFRMNIEQKKQGLLINEVKRLDNTSWLYLPAFLLRRIAYIAIPLLITHKVFQLIALVHLNLISLMIYAS